MDNRKQMRGTSSSQVIRNYGNKVIFFNIYYWQRLEISVSLTTDVKGKRHS